MDIANLTEIEKKIFEMVENGIPTREIAAELGYSDSHINLLKRNAYQKAGKKPPKVNKIIGTYVNGFYIKDKKRENKKTYAYAVCPYCGKEKWIRLDSIQSGNTISCGCFNEQNNYMRCNDLSGREFGRLKAIKATQERDPFNGSVIWECECKCGNICYVSSHRLLGKDVRSCGCFGKENSSFYGKINGRKIVDEYVVDGTNINNLTAKIPKNNTSGIKGVTWAKHKEKWKAQIQFKGKKYHLGYYSDKEQAAEIRAVAEKKMFGDFLEWFAREFPERWERMQRKK